MEINFDKLQDEILDIKDERSSENNIIANKIKSWLKTRKNNRFDFKEIHECVSRNVKPSISYFNHKEGMKWMERFSMSVNCLKYLPDENDFAAVGRIQGKEDISHMMGRNMDLNSLYNLVDWLAAYQREQDGTAKSAEELERESNENRYGKEYTTNEKYRAYIENQLDATERLMLTLYFGATEKQKPFMPMTPRTIFALHIKQL